MGQFIGALLRLQTLSPYGAKFFPYQMVTDKAAETIFG